MRDDSTYVAFVDTRWPALLRLAHLLTGSTAAGEDLLQGVLLKVYVKWPRISRLDHPDAYVRKMLVNAATSHTRTAARRGERLVDEVPEPTFPPAQTAEDRVALWDLVRALPPRQRAVLVLRYYEDLSELEIAQVLGCAPGTVKSQAADALRNLRRSLFTEPTGGRA